MTLTRPGIEIDVLRFEALPGADFIAAISGSADGKSGYGWRPSANARPVSAVRRWRGVHRRPCWRNAATDEAVAPAAFSFMRDRLRELVHRRALMRLHARRGERTEVLKIMPRLPRGPGSRN